MHDWIYSARSLCALFFPYPSHKKRISMMIPSYLYSLSTWKSYLKVVLLWLHGLHELSCFETFDKKMSIFQTPVAPQYADRLTKSVRYRLSYRKQERSYAFPSYSALGFSCILLQVWLSNQAWFWLFFGLWCGAGRWEAELFSKSSCEERERERKKKMLIRYMLIYWYRKKNVD